MKKVSLVPAAETLEEGQKRFETWRQRPNRSRKIPEDLWDAAVGLCREHRVLKVARALRLSHTDLKQRIKASVPSSATPTFIELGRLNVPEEVVVDLEDGTGRRMRIHCGGSLTGAILPDLLSSFRSDGK